MNFYDNAAAVRSKIEKALADKHLVLSIRETYPITMIISQSQAPEDQMAILGFGEDGASSVDASLQFVFDVEGMKVLTYNRLIITDAFMTTLRGLAKKWHTAYIHAFFAAHNAAAKAISEDAGEDAPNEEEIEAVTPDDFPEEGVDPFEDFMDAPEEWP